MFRIQQPGCVEAVRLNPSLSRCLGSGEWWKLGKVILKAKIFSTFQALFLWGPRPFNWEGTGSRAKVERKTIFAFGKSCNQRFWREKLSLRLCCVSSWSDSGLRSYLRGPSLCLAQPDLFRGSGRCWVCAWHFCFEGEVEHLHLTNV